MDRPSTLPLARSVYMLRSYTDIVNDVYLPAVVVVVTTVGELTAPLIT